VNRSGAGYSQVEMTVNKTLRLSNVLQKLHGKRRESKSWSYPHAGSPFDPSRCYTVLTMTPEDEDYFLNPPPGSAAERAVEFGIDLTLTLENLRLSPEDRIRKLDDFILGVQRLKASARRVGPTHATSHENN
jgi:hypothetical protein